MDRNIRALSITQFLRMITGGNRNQSCWFILGFMLLFFWNMGGVMLLREKICFRGEIASVDGTITGSEKTLFSNNKDVIYKHRYE